MYAWMRGGDDFGSDERREKDMKMLKDFQRKKHVEFILGLGLI